MTRNITSFPWAVGAEPIASQLGIFAAQLFFAHRCYHLAGRSKILLFGILGGKSGDLVTPHHRLIFPIHSAMLTTLGISAYIAFCLIDPSHDPMALVKARTVSAYPCRGLFMSCRHSPLLGRYTVSNPQSRYVLSLCVVVAHTQLRPSAATDLTVTACTTWALYKSSKSGINPNTQTVLRRYARNCLSHLVVDTCWGRMIATIWEAAAPPVVAVALSSAFRQTLGSVNIVYVLFNMLATRLYAFSLLYTLNS